MKNYYEILGIKNFTESQDEIREAYMTLISYFHPDEKCN